MITGVLKWFDRKKGFGFIEPEAGEDVGEDVKDVYVSRGSFRRDLTLGELDDMTARAAPEAARRVEYEIENLGDGGDRVRAKNVYPLPS